MEFSKYNKQQSLRNDVATSNCCPRNSNYYICLSLFIKAQHYHWITAYFLKKKSKTQTQFSNYHKKTLKKNDKQLH